MVGLHHRSHQRAVKIKTLLDIMKVFRVFNLVEDIGCFGKSLNTTKSIFPEKQKTVLYQHNYAA